MIIYKCSNFMVGLGKDGRFTKEFATANGVSVVLEQIERSLEQVRGGFVAFRSLTECSS